MYIPVYKYCTIVNRSINFLYYHYYEYQPVPCMQFVMQVLLVFLHVHVHVCSGILTKCCACNTCDMLFHECESVPIRVCLQ